MNTSKNKLLEWSGGVNKGLPGIRSDGNYYAYIRDTEGNKICAKYNSN